MREIKINCTECHEHFPTYPTRKLKNPFTEKDIGQIFIRTAPYIAENTTLSNPIGIPQPTRESVDEMKLKLVGIREDKSLDFVIVHLVDERIHLPSDFNDQKWNHADSFLEFINEKDIVCKPTTEEVQKWSDWAIDGLLDSLFE